MMDAKYGMILEDCEGQSCTSSECALIGRTDQYPVNIHSPILEGRL